MLVMCVLLLIDYVNSTFRCTLVSPRVLHNSLTLLNCLLLPYSYMPLQHKPVAPGWRVSTCSFSIYVYTWWTRVGHNLCNSHGLLLSFMWVLMHWHTCKSLLNTLGRAVEQLAGCLAKQAEVTRSRSKYNSCKAARRVKMLQPTKRATSKKYGGVHPTNTHR